MSDIVPQPIPSSLTYEISTIIRSYLSQMFTANFGVVKSVYGSPATTVDITMANQRTINGQYVDPDVIYGVEVLWPGSSVFKNTFNLNSGDIVLMVGLTSYVEKSSSLTAPSNQFGSVAPSFDSFTHSFGTAKAIPLVGYSGSETVGVSFLSNNLEMFNGSTVVKLDGSSGLASIKTASNSLFTVLNGLITELKTFATTCEGSATDPTLVSAATSLLASLTLTSTALSQVLEA